MSRRYAPSAIRSNRLSDWPAGRFNSRIVSFAAELVRLREKSNILWKAGLVFALLTLPSLSYVEGDPEPILSVIDLLFGSPGIELPAGANLHIGSSAQVVANLRTNGRQEWMKGGVVLDKGAPADPDSVSVNAPSVMYDNSEYKMWYYGTDAPWPKSWILYANSTDGIVWIKHGVVLSPGPPGEDLGLITPSVLKNGTTYHMWYAGWDGSDYRIFYATSPDGLTWTRQGIAVDVGGPGSLDSQYAYDPFVMYDGGYKMWYSGFDGITPRILWADSADGVNWSKHGMSIDRGPPGSLDDAAITGATILKDAGWYHAWYAGSDGSTNRIFYATSSNGTVWDKKGMIVDTGPGSTELIGVSAPSVIQLAGIPCQMWYVGRGSGFVDRIHYANLTSVPLPISVGVGFYLDAVSPANEIGFNITHAGTLSPALATITWRALSPGHHFIYAVIDPSNQIPEIDEGNNTALIQLDVTNSPPTANAGPDQTVFRNEFTSLDGSGSGDTDGDPLTFVWVQTGGIPLPMTGGDTPNPTVIPYVSGSYEFRLTVHDEWGGFSNDTMNLTVTNRQPTADAGPDRTEAKRTSVQLDGTASADPDGDQLTYSWTQIVGPAVALFGSDTATPTFIPSILGSYEFRLAVDDGDGGTSSDTVNVTVANLIPMADAGQDATVAKRNVVQLDGRGSSDPDNDALTFSWIQTGGPFVVIHGADTATPTFVPMVAGSYFFTLTVDDGDGGTDGDTVRVNVTNTGPIADAGTDMAAWKHTIVVLNGTLSSDTDGDVLGFAWIQTGGPTVVLSPSDAATPSFMPHAAGAYSFQLTVSDGDGETASDSVTVIVANRDPEAYAGQDRTVPKKSVVQLDGGASTDPDGDSLAYSWVQVSGPAVALQGADTESPALMPGVSGIYTFRLTVDDGDGGTASDSVNVTVTNQNPTADAGQDISVRKLSLVTLNGVGSADPDGDLLTHGWTQTGGAPVILTGASTATPTFTATTAGTFTFSLNVDDGDGGMGTDSVVVTIWSLSPLAVLTADSKSVIAGSTIMFDGSLSRDLDGTIVNYSFDFGGGNVMWGIAQMRNHSYSNPGNYAVALTVTDDDGDTSSAMLIMTVNAPPPPHDLLAEIWWLIVLLAALVIIVIFLAAGWKKWKKRAQEAEFASIEKERKIRTPEESQEGPEHGSDMKDEEEIQK